MRLLFGYIVTIWFCIIQGMSSSSSCCQRHQCPLIIWVNINPPFSQVCLSLKIIKPALSGFARDLGNFWKFHQETKGPRGRIFYFSDFRVPSAPKPPDFCCYLIYYMSISTNYSILTLKWFFPEFTSLKLSEKGNLFLQVYPCFCENNFPSFVDFLHIFRNYN